jgi:hypothetical protein
MSKLRKDHQMARRATTTTIKGTTRAKEAMGCDVVTPEESAPQPHGQQKVPEQGQFCLQVDRQTKASYATYEAAEAAALAIKKAHPIVRVAIFDTLERVSTVIELP